MDKEDAKNNQNKDKENPKNNTSTDSSEEEVKELKDFLVKTVKDEAVKIIETVNFSKNISDEAKKAVADELTKFKKGEKSELDVEKILKGIKSVKGNQGVAYEFAFKSLSELNSLTGEVILQDRKDGITRDPQRPLVIEDLCTVSTTNSDKISYVEAINETGAPATTAELESFPNKDFEFSVFEVPVKKLSVSSKASNEVLEDIPQLIALINNWLIEDMNLKAEEKILNGSGLVGEFTGIKTIAPTFAPGSFAGTIQNANKFDVLRVALAQITKTSKTRFFPNAILMNPDDVATLDLTKDKNDNYVLPPFTTADKTVIKGIKIVETPIVSADEFIVGDFKRCVIANRRGLSLQTATENEDDFLKDMITTRLSRRWAVYVRNNDVGAFVKGTFSDAITAIKS